MEAKIIRLDKFLNEKANLKPNIESAEKEKQCLQTKDPLYISTIKYSIVLESIPMLVAYTLYRHLFRMP